MGLYATPPVLALYHPELKFCYTFEMGILDIIFPKFCINCRKFGSYLCPACFTYVTFNESGFCVVCQKAAIGGLTHPICKSQNSIDGVFSSLVYTGVVKKLVYQFKYKPYLTNLQGLLTDFFYEGLIQKEQFYKLLAKESVLIPIPLHSTKFRKRGYNQSFLLSQGLSKKFNIHVADCLVRTKNTKTQVGLTQKERLDNIKDAFVLKKEAIEEINKKQIFLVDDIVTSGSTLKEAAKILKKVGVGKVWGITLAHGL